MARAKKGIMSTVLGRMASSEVLISDRHADSMLFGLLAEAEKVEDPAAAWASVQSEVRAGWGWDEEVTGPEKPFIYNDGVAVIPVHGILVNRFPYCWGFITGYDFIRRQMNAALADDDVKLIVYDHDTPGGEAAGCDELAREILASRDVKPSLALVNTSSCSGGFWLATPCTRVVCAPSGSVGSIGVYILTMNFAKFFAEAGIEFDFVKAGKFKTSGNPYEEMSEEDRAYLQSMVDERYEEFCAAVAEFRGVDKSVARDTEARVMRPTEAIALGLIDAAVSPAEAVSNFVAELGEPNGDPDEPEEEIIMAELTAEERAAILKEERERIKGITTCEQAKGRTALAEHLAHNTDMTVEAATAILAAAPKVEDPKPGEGEGEGNGDGNGDGGGNGDGNGDGGEGGEGGEGGDSARGGKSQFEQAMDNGEHPGVGAGKGEGAGGKGDRVSQILDAQSKLTGRKVKA